MRRMRTPFTVMALTNPKSAARNRRTSVGRICRKKNGLSSVGGSSSAGGVGTALVSARALWSGLTSGSWFRANGSSSSRTFSTIPGAGVDVGAWRSWPSGRLALSVAHEWTQASRGKLPTFDKDALALTFLQYKGAEAGEVDWRPTETIPEDFYAM